MGQVLHGSARTTEAVRRTIQHCQESLRALSKRYGSNPKTVAKWKQLHRHLSDFINAYNYGRRLKTLKGLTPYEYICKNRAKEPDRFDLDPIMPGLNT